MDFILYKTHKTNDFRPSHKIITLLTIKITWCFQKIPISKDNTMFVIHAKIAVIKEKEILSKKKDSLKV